MVGTRNFVQPGKVLTLIAPSGGVVAGLAYLIGSLLVVAQNSAAEGAEFEGAREGVWTLAKETGAAWTIGQRLYWDAGNARFTGDAIDGALYGLALSAAESGAAVGNVLLLGGVPGVLEGPQAAIADLTFGTNIAAATANGALTDSSATNPTEAEFNELAKELGTRINGIYAVLRTIGALTP